MRAGPFAKPPFQFIFPRNMSFSLPPPSSLSLSFFPFFPSLPFPCFIPFCVCLSVCRSVCFCVCPLCLSLFSVFSFPCFLLHSILALSSRSFDLTLRLLSLAHFLSLTVCSSDYSVRVSLSHSRTGRTSLRRSMKAAILTIVSFIILSVFRQTLYKFFGRKENTMHTQKRWQSAPHQGATAVEPNQSIDRSI